MSKFAITFILSVLLFMTFSWLLFYICILGIYKTKILIKDCDFEYVLPKGSSTNTYMTASLGNADHLDQIQNDVCVEVKFCLKLKSFEITSGYTRHYIHCSPVQL